MLTSGKSFPEKGAGVLLGELDSPLPNRFGTMMKYSRWSRVRPSPISHSLPVCRPQNHVGKTTTLSRLSFNSKLDRQALLVALVDGYLSVVYRDGLSTSCAVTTLAGDVARCNDRTRSAYTQQVDTYLEVLTKLIASDKRKSRRVKAISVLSALVGAVSLARAVNDEKLSREILKSVADELKAQLG